MTSEDNSKPSQTIDPLVDYVVERQRETTTAEEHFKRLEELAWDLSGSKLGEIVTSGSRPKTLREMLGAVEFETDLTLNLSRHHIDYSHASGCGNIIANAIAGVRSKLELADDIIKFEVMAMRAELDSLKDKAADDGARQEALLSAIRIVVELVDDPVKMASAVRELLKHDQ